MSNCINDGTLQAWLDGELPREAAAAAQMHVTTCASCAAHARSARQALSLADDGWEDDLPVTIPEVRLRDRLDEAMADALATELPAASHQVPHWGLVAAAVVLVIGLTIPFRNSPQVTSPPAPQENVTPLPLDPSPVAPVAVAANLPAAPDRSGKQDSISSPPPARAARPVRGDMT